MLNFKTSSQIFLSVALLAVSTPIVLMSQIANAHEVKASTDKEARISEVYDLKGFDKISITGVYDLDVKVGAPYSLEVSGPKSEMEAVEITLKDGTLILGKKDENNKTYNRNSRKGMVAQINLPSLNSLQIAGVGTGEIQGVEADAFTLEIGGVGELSISGSCKFLQADIAGVGEINTKDLRCKTAEINLAGVGEMTAYASETVDVSAAGVGSVKVYGGPKDVSKSKTFLSSVKIYD